VVSIGEVEKKEGDTDHVVRFVVDAEDDLGVACESLRKLSPELLELRSGGCCWVGRVTNNLFLPD
jgi:hypothetical protein